MDMAVAKIRIKSEDPTCQYGNVEVECTSELFIRNAQGAALFTVNGTNLDTLVVHDNMVDIAKMHDTARKLCLSAFKRAKKSVDAMPAETLVSKKWEKRRRVRGQD